MDSFAEIWQVVQEELKNSVTEVAYKVWLSPLEFKGFKDGKIYLSITEFKRKIIIDKFSYLIDSTLESVFGFPVEVEYVVPTDQVKNENSKNESSSVNDYNYTFKNWRSTNLYDWFWTKNRFKPEATRSLLGGM